MLILRQTDKISIASQWVIALIAFQLLPFSPAPIKAQLLLAGFHCTFPGKFKNKLLHVFNTLPLSSVNVVGTHVPSGCPPALPGPRSPVPMATRWCRSTAAPTRTDRQTQGHSGTPRDTQTPTGTDRHAQQAQLTGTDTGTLSHRHFARVYTTLCLPGEDTPYLSPLGGQCCWDSVPRLHRSQNQNPGMGGVGRDQWKTSSPISPLK